MTYGPENPYIRVPLEAGDLEATAQCCYDYVFTPGAGLVPHWSELPEKSLPGTPSKEAFRILAESLIQAWKRREEAGHGGSEREV